MLGLQHNIISILYALRGTAEIYHHKIEENSFSGLRERLKAADLAIHKMHQLTSHALDITKKLGQVLKISENAPSIIVPISLQETWAVTRRLLAAEFRAGKVDIIEHIPEDFPKIRCCRKDLKEILYCLAKNAAEAMRIEDTVKMSMAFRNKLIIRAELALREETAWSLITIADTGPGIPNEILSRLFQPFFSTKENHGGNGLGLYLTRQLILKNKGRIGVSSFAGCGSAFSLELPLATADCTAASVYEAAG